MLSDQGAYGRETSDRCNWQGAGTVVLAFRGCRCDVCAGLFTSVTGRRPPTRDLVQGGRVEAGGVVQQSIAGEMVEVGV